MSSEITEASGEQSLLEIARHNELSHLFDVDSNKQVFPPPPSVAPRQTGKRPSFPNHNPLALGDLEALAALNQPLLRPPGSPSLPTPEQLRALHPKPNQETPGQDGILPPPNGVRRRVPRRGRTLAGYWRRFCQYDGAKESVVLFSLGVAARLVALGNGTLSSALLVVACMLPILVGMFKPQKREMLLSTSFFVGVLLSTIGFGR